MLEDVFAVGRCLITARCRCLLDCHSATIAVEHDAVLADDRCTLIEIAACAEVSRTKLVGHRRDLLLHGYTLTITRLKLLRIRLVRHHRLRIVRRDDTRRRNSAVAHADFLAAVRDDRRLSALDAVDRLAHCRNIGRIKILGAFFLLMWYNMSRRRRFVSVGRARLFTLCGANCLALGGISPSMVQLRGLF